MTGRKSRHYRNGSDLLLGLYSSNLAATTSSLPPRAPDDSRGNPISSSPKESSIPPLLSRNTNGTFLTSTDGSGVMASTPLLPDNKRGSPPDDQKKRRKKKQRGYRVHRVSYTAQNHVQVLFRRYASAFPQVLPFAISNAAWTLCIFHLKRWDIFDLTFHSSVGHSFMGLLVSFLIVNRSKISYDRFMEYRRHLAESYRACVSHPSVPPDSRVAVA